MRRKGRVLFFVLAWILGAAFSADAKAATEILGVRHWVAPDHTRLVIDTSHEADFRIEKVDRQITLIFADAVLPAALAGLKVFNKPGLQAVSLSAFSPSKVIIEIRMFGNLQTNVFKLKKFRDKPERIVVDIILPEADQNDNPTREETGDKKKEWVVVIDPGHGGDAPGAVGKEGTYEKDVVLDIARKLQDIINKKNGYRAFLTRKGDYYVTFKKRLMIAREHGADLFLSIHADAAKNRAARGSSVYCIAAGAASSEAAKILADNENLADVIGGVPAGEQSDISDPIILDMFQNHVKNQSQSFGRILLSDLKAVSGIKFEDVQEASFYVLKLPEITSVLLETAFISNLKEEKLLRNGDFQEKIALAAADAIVKFLPPLPASGGYPGDASAPTTVYKVKSGDTLYSIAVSHGTTTGAIKQLNNLKRPDLLYVGSKLVIPRKAN